MAQAASSNITSINGGPTIARHPVAQLEYELHDITNMSFIARSMTEKLFGDTKGHLMITGRKDAYHLSPDELSALQYAIYTVDGMIRALRDQYLAVLESKH